MVANAAEKSLSLCRALSNDLFGAGRIIVIISLFQAIHDTVSNHHQLLL
ncbi:hypothetical protein D1BOALGB6SA_2577 [Olavius sp. associated proteobacterium Delta 1]|nr:hypothetical protein D1BOALGB6SA_2577 [Olavius sp. associated proteobacterium Delta 1]